MADKIVKEVSVQLKASGYEDAKLKIDRLTVASKELGEQRPEIKPHIDSTRALLEARLLRQGIQAELSRITAGSGGGVGTGWFGNLASLPGGVSGPSPGLIGAALGIPVAEAALPLVTGLVSGVAAASAGLGAFGILSAGTFSQLKQDVSQYQAAWEKLQKAQGMFAVDPTKQTAAAVQKAQFNLQATQLGLGQDAGPAAAAINGLRIAYDKLSAAISPVTFRVITDAAKAVTTFLPNLLPFAQAGGKALDGLLQKVQTFFQTADFKKWLDKFLPIVGPAIDALGTGVGKVVIAVGKLFEKMSAHDVVHAINTTFDIITGAINILSGVVSRLMSNWDRMTGAFAEGWRNIRKWTAEAVSYILERFGLIIQGAVDAFGWIPGIGAALKKAQADFDNFQAHLAGGLNAIQGIATTTSGSLAGVAWAALNAFNKTPGAGPSGGKVRGLAAGGPAGGIFRVGELGPELVWTPPGSYVYNAAQSRAMAGGNTYNIHVSVPPSANPAEVGRQIAVLLNQYEQRSGTGWRKP